jgi:uncharacterized membrane protein
MTYLNPRSTASLGGHPLHPMLVPFPVACFVGAFLTDIAYSQTYAVMWETFSVWLLTAGLIMGGFAVLAGLIDFLGSRRIRGLTYAWPHALGNLLVMVLSLVNAFVHSRDGYTAVVPTGIALSGLVVLIMIVTGWMGWSMVYRDRVGVTN